MSLRPAVLIAVACLALGAAPPALHAAGVVGNGTPGSCTEAALSAALVGGGNVTFNCGSNPVVITFTTQKLLQPNTSTTIDGGNADRIIFSGNNAVRHFLGRGNVANPANLTIRNLTLRDGRCPLAANPPDEPAPGYGASIRSGIGGALTVEDSKFINNICTTTGEDMGGGAIRQRRGTLIVRRTQFTGNRAANAGAISSSDALVTIEDSAFTNNSTNAHVGGASSFSGVGGGFYNDGSADGFVTIRRSSFTNNSATFAAGAIQAFFRSNVQDSSEPAGQLSRDLGLILEDCAFYGNTSGTSIQGAGGVLASVELDRAQPSTATVTVDRSTFTGNSGRVGGAIYANEAPSTIRNSTITGNSATDFAGGIWVQATSLTLNHVTLADNQAGLLGGAIGMSQGGAAPVTGTIRGSIIANNTVTTPPPTGIPGHCNQTLSSGGPNIQFPSTGSCVSGATASDPLLGALATNGGLTQTRAIPGNSPARNLVPSGCPPPATDQRGVTRPQGGACDAGAYEANITIDIGDIAVTEGTGANVPAAFLVTLSAAASQTVTVAYATNPGTAAAGGDYTGATGTVTFTPGDVSQPVTIQVVGDTLDEDDETFFVDLSSPNGGSIGDGRGTGTITDNDPAPSISAGPCTALEGGPGTSAPCTALAVLSTASGKTVSVSYSTANGSAAAGSDYTSTAGTLTLTPGVLSGGITVPVLGDSVDEVDETFAINLSNPTNATLGGSGTGTIDDDDGPSVAVNSVAVNEGNAGTTPATFTLSLSATSPQTVAVSYSTSDGTADSGADYAAAANQATFAPGVLTQNVIVNVNGDGTTEPNESFFLNLLGATEGTIGVAAGAGTIRNDDGTTPVVRELGHGAGVRDGFTAAADIFSVGVPARTSWELVVDESSGDAGGASGPAVQQVDNDRTTVLQNSTAAGLGAARSLRLQNTGGSGAAYYVRVASSQCSADCGPDDRYRIRAYETTLRTPRFNNSGSQFTVVILQNTVTATVAGTIYFWGPSGALLGSQSFSLPGRALLSLNTTTVPGIAGQGGAVTIVHDGRYADLSGKAVSLDPAAGFSFDSALAPPPR